MHGLAISACQPTWNDDAGVELFLKDEYIPAFYFHRKRIASLQH